MIMNNENNSSNHKEKETKLIVTSLLTDIIMEVLLIRQHHLAKLIENVYVDVENESDNEIQYNICVKYEKVDKRIDQIIVIMKTCLKVVNRLI